MGRAVAYPFDTLKVKLATDDTGISLGEMVRQILKAEGLSGFYRGIQFSVIEATFQKGLHVYYYASMKQIYRKITGAEPASLGMLFCGYLSDLSCVPTSVPIEAMVVQLQSAPVGASRARIIHDALFTWHGISTAMKSGRAYLVLSLKAGIEFGIYDRIKTIILGARQRNGDASSSISAIEAFWLGAFARSIATVVMYPYARGKALAQAKLAPSATEAILSVLKTEGAKALYRGLSMELMRGVAQSAVMFAIMEKVRASLLRIVAASDRQRKLTEAKKSVDAQGSQ